MTSGECFETESKWIFFTCITPTLMLKSTTASIFAVALHEEPTDSHGV